MSRRPKLTLAANNEKPKKQASGFEVAPEKKEEQPDTVSHVSVPSHSQKHAEATPQEYIENRDPDSGLSRRNRYIGALLVVAAAALSLYLLRR
ncbi:MAG: hypothetical protein GY703_15005 [Gammaproteobacteria bacterium]|nr:hypothetical protein [Gammaproteobacteria bacterium]